MVYGWFNSAVGTTIKKTLLLEKKRVYGHTGLYKIKHNKTANKPKTPTNQNLVVTN